ncbi:MAG: hypothetical protein ACUZ8E_09360 [Candidatus Anammoxibacter sp.]
MDWLVVICFAIFAIGLIGALVNILSGKNPWSQNSSSSSDAPWLEEGNDSSSDADKELGDK